MRFAGIQLCQFNVFAESLKDAVDLLFKVGITCACFTLGHSMLISAGERGVESRTDRSTTREAELRQVQQRPRIIGRRAPNDSVLTVTHTRHKPERHEGHGVMCSFPP